MAQERKLSFLTGDALPFVWMPLIVILLFRATTSIVSPASNFLVMGAVGIAAWLLDRHGRADTLRLLRQQAMLFTGALALMLAIVLSEILAAQFHLSPSHIMPAQATLLLCLLPLALWLRDIRWLYLVVVAGLAVSAWHMVMMPIEAVTGWKISWHDTELRPRDSGPFTYQAAGLAAASFYFPGFFLPLFYLAWGPLYEGRVFQRLQRWRSAMLVLPFAWLVPVACVQSRSALVGALAATALIVYGESHTKRGRIWLAAGTLALAAVATFWAVYLGDKTGLDLRLAYIAHYFRVALDSRWALTGHGFSWVAQQHLMAPGQQMLLHSHNDFAQMIYAWGLTALVAYLVFWAALVRLVYTRFVVRGEYWPACALLAVIPSMQTDLGFHHLEKACLLVLVSALCMALTPSRRAIAPSSEPPADNLR